MGNVDDQTPSLRLHPELDRARFVPRLGFRQERLAPLLAAEGITLTASPLYFVEHNPELALFARSDPALGLALDPATHLRQVPHAQRSASFRKLPFGGDPTTFDPDRPGLSERDYADLVREPLNLARARGGTLILCAYHLSGGVGSNGRSLDLQIAGDAIEYFRLEGMAEPPEGAAVPARRELYVPLAMTTATLESVRERHRLIEAYAELDADGYWVKVNGLSEKSPLRLIETYAAFLSSLRHQSQRPVVADGCGHLHVGLLANDISTSIGLGEAERFAMPADRAGRDWSAGRAHTVYHERFLRSFRSDHKAAQEAFLASPCVCKRHPMNEPPRGAQIDEHVAVVRSREAQAALEGAVDERREWLLATAALAAELGADSGVTWTRARVFEALFRGFDSPEEEFLRELG